MNATATTHTDDLYAWAKVQGNLGVAVLFVRAFEAGRLTDQLVAQATKVRDRQSGTVVPTPASIPVVEDETISTNPWPGIYTLEHEDGHTTFRVKVQGPDAKFAPGATLIELLSGHDNTSDYTTFGFLRSGKLSPFKGFRDMPHLLARANQFLADPAAVLTSKNCIRCNRILSTPDSIAAGIGPECARK